MIGTTVNHKSLTDRGRDRPPRPTITPAIEEAQKLGVVDLMHLLGGGLAFEILVHLANGPDSVTRIAERLGWATSQVSQMLNQLKRHGYLTVRQVRRYRYYALADTIEAIIEPTGEVRLGVPCEAGRLEIRQAVAG